MINTNPITLTRHLISLQQKYPQAGGDFTLLMNAITMACKFIASKVSHAGIISLYGMEGGTNLSGDEQKKLDVISNDIFINILKSTNRVCLLASEENDDFILCDNDAKYVVAFDPLDGSSNIDANVTIGTIFGIWRRKSDTGTPATIQDLLQSGKDILCGGYCVYGPSTQIVLALGGNVNGYTLDTSIGEFILTHPDIKIPKQFNIYSINEGNSSIWNECTIEYVHKKKYPQEGKVYSLRYVGSMVSDVHRTLLYGGIFMYPSDKKSKTGKLRLLYECYPMAFIIEQAGGKAINGIMRLLDVPCTQIHERSGIVLGSDKDVQEYQDIAAKYL